MTKILVDKVVLEQALEALEADNSKLWPSDKRTAAYFNLRAVLVEPVQEPVVWMLKSDIEHPSGWRTVFLHTSAMPTKDSVPLYTAPPQRKPLTEEEIDKIADHLDATVIGWSTHEFTRAIEAAHGIAGESPVSPPCS